MFHNCDTIGGYSGGGIINKDNNCVIAIHQGKKESVEYNVGIYMNSIINLLNF